MSFIGILYSPPMIEAKQAGRKDVTRRLAQVDGSNDDELAFKAPCAVGDVLWVREQHYAYGHWIIDEGEFTQSGRQRTKFLAYDHRGVVFPDRVSEIQVETKKWGPVGWYKRLGRFMPKAYCRMWDEVIDVRFERLHKITDADAIREGIGSSQGQEWSKTAIAWEMYGEEGGWTTSPTRSYQSLWDIINPGTPWSINPWVFRIETKPIGARPKDFLK